MLDLVKNIAKRAFRRAFELCVLILFTLIAFSTESQSATVKNLRMGLNSDGFRLVFDADFDFNYKTFLLNEPRRLVVDIYDCNVIPSIEKFKDKTNLISKIRIGTIDSTSRRIALDLTSPVVIKKAFMLAPQSNFGWRFVIDVINTTPQNFNAHIGSKYAIDSHVKMKSTASSKKETVKVSSVKSRKIIVLDPGHGGKDPGAIGYSG